MVAPNEQTSCKHRAALITGGAKRIGRAISLALAQSGFDVAITYRESSAEAAETVRSIESLGVRATALKLDLRSEQSVQQAIASTLNSFGRLDLLVNNAGIFESAPLDQISLAQWDAMFETNTRGPFLMAREALPHLKAASGRIVNLGSLGGSHPWASHAHYCSSKASMDMLTKTMAKAFAPEVSVNCVAPGWIQLGVPDRASANFAVKTPMKRNGTAEEVAAAVLFFATGPHYITGQTLSVDGGLGLY